MKNLLFIALLTLSYSAFAATIPVKNIDELNAANKNAKPGDIIILQNGEWKDVKIILDAVGTAAQPITFKAQQPGKVHITGHSSLALGGEYIIVDGFLFTNGFSGERAVIEFRKNKNTVANNCRVTNSAIRDFNNKKRMDENNWVLMFGKNNRLDHCSFTGKTNMGVLLAVILDDERSRENFHWIDHNYFGKRIPLASNGGEIIRVGVSQHATFNSGTQIMDNLFEHCDGETEIVSIKSGGNIVKGNVFKECQGSVVLRHGDNNIVTNNLFLGNHKKGTGGVRVINKGQTVVNNYFYGCRGTDFRSPLAIMNGIPNSPAHRYVQVTDAIIANNTFQDCAPVTFGEGSDTERTLPPSKVDFINNLFFNNRDSIIYKIYDDISGINFINNKVSAKLPQQLAKGFSKEALTAQKNDNRPFPVYLAKFPVEHQIQAEVKKRLGYSLPDKAGFQDLNLAKTIQARSAGAGASWFQKNIPPLLLKKVNAKDAGELYTWVEKAQPLEITLTGSDYVFHKPLEVSSHIIIKGKGQKYIDIHTVPGLHAAFLLNGNGHLTLDKIVFDGDDIKSSAFISSDSSGPSAHFNIILKNSTFRNFNRANGCATFIRAEKSTIADSIVIDNCIFDVNRTNLIDMSFEKDNKGYYNAEKIRINNTEFSYHTGYLLDIYRGGNDESTLGPDLDFSGNRIGNTEPYSAEPLIKLTGVQKSSIYYNDFVSAHPGKSLITYIDFVRAAHRLERNDFTNSGEITTNKFVTETKNNKE